MSLLYKGTKLCSKIEGGVRVLTIYAMVKEHTWLYKMRETVRPLFC